MIYNNENEQFTTTNNNINEFHKHNYCVKEARYRSMYYMTHSTYIHYKNTSNCAFQSENPGYPFGGTAAYVTGREYEGGFWVRFSFIIWVLVTLVLSL